MSMDMDECGECLSESDQCGICDAGCATSLCTMLDTGPLKYIKAVELFSTNSPQNYISNSSPPDPFPPRISNLI